MTKPEPDFSRDELLAEFTEMLRPGEGKRGLTTEEIAEQLGTTVQTVRRLLRTIHKQGKLVRENIRVECYDGSYRKTHAYSIRTDD